MEILELTCECCGRRYFVVDSLDVGICGECRYRLDEAADALAGLGELTEAPIEPWAVVPAGWTVVPDWVA